MKKLCDVGISIPYFVTKSWLKTPVPQTSQESSWPRARIPKNFLQLNKFQDLAINFYANYHGTKELTHVTLHDSVWAYIKRGDQGSGWIMFSSCLLLYIAEHKNTCSPVSKAPLKLSKFHRIFQTYGQSLTCILHQSCHLVATNKYISQFPQQNIFTMIIILKRGTLAG